MSSFGLGDLNLCKLFRHLPAVSLGQIVISRGSTERKYAEVQRVVAKVFLGGKIRIRRSGLLRRL